MKRLVVLLPYLAVTSLLAACGGGGSGSTAMPSSPVTSGTQGAQLMGITFSGTTTLSRVRSAQSITGTAITAKLNGVVVGTGTLDGNGHAVITFTTSVPRGSTLILTAGSTTLTVVLAKDVPATTVTVTATASGFTILASGDPTGTGNAAPSMNDNDAEDMDEGPNGNIVDIDNPMATTLPANLPISIVAACSGIVISPLATGIASIRVREQTDDDNDAGDNDSAAKLDVRGSFTTPATFPIVSTAARLRVEVFGQPNEQGGDIFEVRAPISAVTAATTAPSPCPTPFPGTQTIASPSPSPAASPTAMPT